MAAKTIYTRQELKQHLGISSGELCALENEGLIKVQTAGGRCYVHTDDIDPSVWNRFHKEEKTMQVKTPMSQLLDALIEDSPQDGMVEIQITFNPGAASTAGGLRHGPVPGTYCLCTGSKATEHTPGMKAGDLVMIEQIFEADAVQRVTRQLDSSIVAPGLGGNGSIIPGVA